MTNRHFVHVYGVACFKFAVDGCTDQAAAIEAARNAYFESTNLLNRSVRAQGTLEPPNGNRLQLINISNGDEIVRFLVDAGDTKFALYNVAGEPIEPDA